MSDKRLNDLNKLYLELEQMLVRLIRVGDSLALTKLDLEIWQQAAADAEELLFRPRERPDSRRLS